MEFFEGLWRELVSGDRPLLSFLFFLNILLLVLARPILNLIAPGQDNKSKVKIFQGLNFLVIIFHIIDFALRGSVDGYKGYCINLGISLMVIYGGVFLYSLAGTLSRKRFGVTRKIEGKDVYVESYNSRMVSIVPVSYTHLTLSTICSV